MLMKTKSTVGLTDTLTASAVDVALTWKPIAASGSHAGGTNSVEETPSPEYPDQNTGLGSEGTGPWR